jgi:hypothetical protein
MTCSRMLFLGVLIGGGSLTISSQPIHAQGSWCSRQGSGGEGSPGAQSSDACEGTGGSSGGGSYPGLSGWRSRGQASDYAPSSRSSLE